MPSNIDNKAEDDVLEISTVIFPDRMTTYLDENRNEYFGKDMAASILQKEFQKLLGYLFPFLWKWEDFCVVTTFPCILLFVGYAASKKLIV